MKGLWDYINNKKFWMSIGVLGGFLALKHLFLNRFVPISEIKRQIQNQQISKAILGNLMMLCYFRSPQSGQWSYCLTKAASDMEMGQVYHTLSNA